MAKFVIAGVEDCCYYVRAEMLGDKLALNLPDFKIHKMVKTNGEWKDWLSEICEANGWKHDKSPIIWRELVDRGGKGVLIGGSNDFEEYAYGYYGVTIDMDSKIMNMIAYENLFNKAGLDFEEKERKRKVNFIKLCITNASNPACFSLIDSLLSGKIFGSEKISLCLLDNDPSQMDDLQGIAEDIQNMAYGLLYLNIFVTSDCEKAFEGSRLIIFLDEIEKQEDEKMFEWLQRNADVFGFYGETLSNVAQTNIMLLVGGNNYMSLNMSILNEILPKIPSKNIVGISRLVENQAKSVLASKLPGNSCFIDNVIILGSINNNYLVELDKTLVREFDCAILGPLLFSLPLNDIFHQQQWLKKEYSKEVYSRKSKTEINLQHPAYHLAAHAISTTLDIWWNGTSTKSIFSMTLISEGWYGVPKGIAFSFPVTYYLPLAYSVIEDLSISDKCRQDMDLIIETLVKDKDSFIVENGKLVSKIVSIGSFKEETDESSSERESSRTTSNESSSYITSVMETVEEQDDLELDKKTSRMSLNENQLYEQDMDNENLETTVNETDMDDDISETESNAEVEEAEDKSPPEKPEK